MKIRTILAVMLVALAAACAPAQNTAAPTPVITPPVVEAAPPQENPGSLFDPASASYLYGDERARAVGDLVIVNIIETAKAKNKADTTTERDSSINFGVENYFGKNDTRILPFGSSLGLLGHIGSDPMVKASASNSFEGTGTTQRESAVTATLAARVVRVLPGNLLQIEGAREVKVNNETQILVVRGLARAKDISPDNTIASTHLADAKIDYFGQGVLADKQRPGWLTRILDNIWPF